MAIIQAYAGRARAALGSMEVSIQLNPRPAPYHLSYYGLVLFLNDRSQDAVTALKPVATSRVRSMGDAPAEILAMAYAKIGLLDEAKRQVEFLHNQEPFLNLTYYRVLYAHHARKQDLQLRIDALRTAGIPKWPFNFKQGSNQRLTGAALENLIKAKTWTGRDVGRASAFVRELGQDSSTVHAAANTILNGSSFIKDDQLCERYEGFILGRNLCGPVFRNPKGANETQDQFIYVNPATMLRFSTGE